MRFWEETWHHAYPQVRCKNVGVDPDFPGNRLVVPRGRHDAWHRLFSALTPHEIGDRLEIYFCIIFDAALLPQICDLRIVFGEEICGAEDWPWALDLLNEKWTPSVDLSTLRLIERTHSILKQEYKPGWYRQYRRRLESSHLAEKKRKRRLIKSAVEKHSEFLSDFSKSPHS